MDWILASASPRRKQLFAPLVRAFEILPADCDEDIESDSPQSLVAMLARKKAKCVADLPIAKGKAVLGADTVVALDNEILGKPKDESDARRMLSALSGRVHEVYTGVCMIAPTGETLVEVACTKVRFNELSSAKIEAYIASGSPMDKAGAYGIQDGDLVESIEGSFSNVVGLPVELCKEMIERLLIETTGAGTR